MEGEGPRMRNSETLINKICLTTFRWVMWRIITWFNQPYHIFFIMISYIAFCMKIGLLTSIQSNINSQGHWKGKSESSYRQNVSWIYICLSPEIVPFHRNLTFYSKALSLTDNCRRYWVAFIQVHSALKKLPTTACRQK